MTAASWQPDPSGRHEMRWWDGQRWTDHVNDRGVTSLDALSAAPQPDAFHPLTAQQPTIAQPTAQQPGLTPPTMQQPQYQQPQYQPSLPTTAQPTMAQPTIAQPTMAQPAYQQAAWSSAPPPNRTPVIIGGIVAVIAIGVGAFFLLKGDDKKGAVVETTTIPETSVVDTTQPQESTTEAPTTTVPAVLLDGQTMVNLMPNDDDVPKEWTRTADPDPAPQSQSGPGIGYCGGSNSIGRAQLAGSNAQAYGPTWDLPDKSVFYVDMYAFPSADEAADYLTAILKDANSCSGTGVQFTMPESDAQWFTDSTGDGAIWAVDEAAGATKVSQTTADDAVQAFVDDHFATSVAEVDYSVTASSIIVYERWGSVVVAYTLYGRWAYSGWSSPSDFEHQPTIDELNSAMDLVRDGIVSRLHATGAI